MNMSAAIIMSMTGKDMNMSTVIIMSMTGKDMNMSTVIIMSMTETGTGMSTVIMTMTAIIMRMRYLRAGESRHRCLIHRAR